ncbi:hypothetical protein [Roseivirga sp. UBA838]|uniref:hypothetical protein n=1 Tax=Roseivirga sp. UBA838 TaxID=1947393 RepID=UPI00257A6092|nr:hypothetical protein [Roseivirga sp. UBA838]|tara:strand:+ start:946 stop:1368 length:423 start_codon:yes stop_codon:yes gene_type:complete
MKTGNLEVDKDMFQELFDHMHDEHGLTLLSSELMAIVRIVQDTPQPSAACLPDRQAPLKGSTDNSNGSMSPAGGVKGVEVPICHCVLPGHYGRNDLCHICHLREQITDEEEIPNLIPNKILFGLAGLVVGLLIILAIQIL